MDRPSRQFCEEFAFEDAVDVDMRESRHGFVNNLCNSLYSICPSD